MDVTVPPVPVEYDAYRANLRAHLAEHTPRFEFKPRTGVRLPEGPGELDELRAWIAGLYDAGYVLERFTDEPCDPFEQRIIEEELTATGLPFILGNPLVTGALKAYGTAEQRREYLPRLGRAEHIWTQLFSEPDAGSDLTSLKTRARLDGDHYVVDGQKVWSTAAKVADYGYLLARTGEDPGPKGITAFILDMRSPGVEPRPLREITGGEDFCEVFFDGVQVPVANVIGEPGQGWSAAQVSLAAERGGVGEMGADEWINGLVRLARGRRRNGRPVIEDSDVRQHIAAFAARTRIQRALGHRVATKALQGSFDVWDAPHLKIWVSELNLETVEYGLALQGTRSILAEDDPGAVDDGWWQDSYLYARALTIAGGSNEVMRNMIAERGLGFPREPRG